MPFGGSWLFGGDPGGEEQSDQRDQREGRERGAQPVQAGLFVLVQDGLGDLFAGACLGERGLEVSVGEERDPACQLDVGLGAHLPGGPLGSASA